MMAARRDTVARVESLLSARLFLRPQLMGERIFFITNISGRLSLYAMNAGGSVPEPLLPPGIALQNPELIGGESFAVFPDIGRILVMMDRDGNEMYRPMVIPVGGGHPEPAFEGVFDDHMVHLTDFDPARSVAYFLAESRAAAVNTAYRADLATRALTKLGESPYGCYPTGANASHTRVVLTDAYGVGDNVLYLWEDGVPGRRLLFGVPIEERQAGRSYPPNSISNCCFVDGDRALLLTTSLFSDAYGLGLMSLADPTKVVPVEVAGTAHKGAGELVGLKHLGDDAFAVLYNIDGCSWLYEGTFRPDRAAMELDTVVCGWGELADGVLESFAHDRDRFALSFSTATSPTQIYTAEGAGKARPTRHTNERVLGIPSSDLSAGEDASFTSFDGLRVSARLYLPAPSLGFAGPRPLVYYIHGGPQSQERPDFAWFSMPLIQLLTLRGFAVFVPNVRGSTGYGFDYMKRVQRDWGGQDRLDHVHAMTRVLPKDPRVDVGRAAVVGRSYGGYMTLTLASRDAGLWAAAVDMLGPYDLLTFGERIPETWKPFMAFLLGDPVADREFLVERSPRTYLDAISCPLLVVQGKNDPRVVEPESMRLVEELRAGGKTVDYLMFEDEGHDILKFENRVRCYATIAAFLEEHLRP
jgi:pimeloyl-ACP methyl ester carboxylesterase